MKLKKTWAEKEGMEREEERERIGKKEKNRGRALATTSHKQMALKETIDRKTQPTRRLPTLRGLLVAMRRLTKTRLSRAILGMYFPFLEYNTQQTQRIFLAIENTWSLFLSDLRSLFLILEPEVLLLMTRRSLTRLWDALTLLA